MTGRVRHHRQTGRRLPPVLRTAVGCFLMWAPVMLTSCARLAPPPQEAIEIAVLDFSTPPGLGGEPRRLKGWWFSSRVIHENRRAGTMFADALSDALRKLEYTNPRPRMELKTYFVLKRNALVSKFPGYSSAEYDAMLREITPVEYGADLGVDQVLTGEILDAHTMFHYLSYLWRSSVKVRVDLWDVQSGHLEWSREFRKKRTGLSQMDTMLSLSRQITKDLDRTHYRAVSKQNAAPPVQESGDSP